MTILLGGKPILDNEKDLLKNLVANLKDLPLVTIITNEDDPASKIYVKNKVRDLEECGVETVVLDWKKLVQMYDKKELEHFIYQQQDVGKSGIMFQLPLPDCCPFNITELCKMIRPDKDIDGFTGSFESCTPLGIKKLLEYYDINLSGMNAVVIGRSKEVGKPLADMLINMDATVTVCHSKTRKIFEYTQKADIIFSAVGKKNLIKKDMVNSNAIIIDIGINKNKNNKLCGDCAQDLNVRAITPVPGGIGLTTRAGLLHNVREFIIRQFM